MIDKTAFERFELLPMSYSKLNSFSNYPCQFIINKIFKIDTGSNPAMKTGNLIEEMLHLKFNNDDLSKDEELLIEMYKRKLKKEFADYYDQANLTKYVGYIPKMFAQCDQFVKQLGNYKLQSYQEKIETEILGIPFYGYTDFIFDLDDELWVYDLKTKARMTSPSNSEYIQQWIYKKALEEKYQKPVHTKLFIVTPTKHHSEELCFSEEHEIEVMNKIKGMATMLQKCNTAEDIALLYQPNLDSWEWNEQNIPARKQIWGI